MALFVASLSVGVVYELHDFSFINRKKELMKLSLIINYMGF